MRQYIEKLTTTPRIVFFFYQKVYRHVSGFANLSNLVFLKIFIHEVFIGGVMVIVLTLNAVDHEFEPRSGQTKDYKIGIYCDMFIRGLLFQ